MGGGSRRGFWFAMTVLLVVGCPASQKSPEEIDATLTEVTTSKLETFGSTEDFDGYVRRVDDLQPSGWGGIFGCASPASEQNAGVATNPGDESITNNQELGVDEGDIVKAAGDYFIVLRRGRLFSVKHTDGAASTLVAVSQIDASPPGFKDGTWYDEILVHGDRVILIGYTYRLSATEIGLFRLSAAGELSHEATHFLSSNDYYSSRNYASRLVGDKLIFYMPYYLPVGRRGATADLPSVRRWVKNNELTRWSEILDKVETYKPIQRTMYPTLHTVVQCDLAAEDFSCSARAVIAPYSRSFYVSVDAVYLWVSGEYRYRAAEGEPKAQADGTVYRMPLREAGVTAARVRGSPIDQFSFDEASDGSLNVVASHSGGGDAMWHPEMTAGDLSLVKIPKAAFTTDPQPVDAAAYTKLPKPADAYGIQNRFVGEHLLLGAGTGWDRASSSRSLFVVPVATPGEPRTLVLEHDAERLEVLGAGAAVVGTNGNDLLISSIELGSSPLVKSTFTRPNAAQGETRSHGFFFKQDALGGGVLGLPLRLDGQAYRHLRYGSAEVAFVQVQPDLTLSGFGALGASETDIDDSCVVSCTDWYGNARPIFFRGRTFALLGYELVEAARTTEGMVESARVQFLQAR